MSFNSREINFLPQKSICTYRLWKFVIIHSMGIPTASGSHEYPWLDFVLAVSVIHYNYGFWVSISSHLSKQCKDLLPTYCEQSIAYFSQTFWKRDWLF